MNQFKKRTEFIGSDYLKMLHEKFPNIKVIEGEDLNIERMRVKYLKMMLNDPETYPTMQHIANDMNITERSIYRLMRLYEIPFIKKNN